MPFFSFYSPFRYSSKSPGWQSRASQSFKSVLILTAFALPFFRIEMFASVIPTRFESSVTLILRFASITSMLKIICPSILSPHIVRSLCSCKAAAFFTRYESTADATEIAMPTNDTRQAPRNIEKWHIDNSRNTVVPTNR